jgi:hypothetical protein
MSATCPPKSLRPAILQGLLRRTLNHCKLEVVEVAAIAPAFATVHMQIRQ